MRLSPQERAQFKREIPAVLLLAVLLFVVIVGMWAMIPPVAVSQ